MGRGSAAAFGVKILGVKIAVLQLDAIAPEGS
jgi:hypothetical protein